MKKYTDKNEMLVLMTNAKKINVNGTYYDIQGIESIENHGDKKGFKILIDKYHQTRFALCETVELYEGILITDFTCNHVCNNSYGEIILYCEYLKKEKEWI